MEREESEFDLGERNSKEDLQEALKQKKKEMGEFERKTKVARQGLSADEKKHETDIHWAEGALASLSEFVKELNVLTAILLQKQDLDLDDEELLDKKLSEVSIAERVYKAAVSVAKEKTSTSFGALFIKNMDEETTRSNLKGKVEEPEESVTIIRPSAKIVINSIEFLQTSHLKKMEKHANKITVHTMKDAVASYQLISKPFNVVPDDCIIINYKITVKPEGKISLGLLNSKKNGWYGDELILITGDQEETYEGEYARIIPKGENEAAIVFRNYHLEANGGAGESTFTIEKLRMIIGSY